jgi:hypothetical protein
MDAVPDVGTQQVMRQEAGAQLALLLEVKQLDCVHYLRQQKKQLQ